MKFRHAACSSAQFVSKHTLICFMANILCLVSDSLQMLRESAANSPKHVQFSQTSVRVVSLSAAIIVSASSGKVLGNGRT